MGGLPGGGGLVFWGFLSGGWGFLGGEGHDGRFMAKPCKRTVPHHRGGPCRLCRHTKTDGRIGAWSRMSRRALREMRARRFLPLPHEEASRSIRSSRAWPDDCRCSLRSSSPFTGRPSQSAAAAHRESHGGRQS